MKFHKLTVQNFLTLRHASVNLADRGLQLIQGVNDDDSSASSNGSGKSSLVDAICWCLYGTTARDVKGDAVVNLGVKKDCAVTLTLSSGTSTYKVERYRKHATSKNSLLVSALAADPLSPSTDLSRGTDAETQKVLEKILGCSQAVFMAAVYSGQEAMPDLPKMKDRELKTLIEEAAGLQRIELAYELSREKMNACKSNYATTTSRVAGFAAELERARMALHELQVKFDDWDSGRKVRVAESSVIHSAAISAYKVQSQVVLDLSPAARLAQESIKTIDKSLADHRALQAVAVAAEGVLRSAELVIDRTEPVRLMAGIAGYEKQIANAAVEIKQPCTECGTVLETMSIEDYIAHRTGHLTSAKAALEGVKVKLRRQLDAVSAARTLAEDARSTVPEVTELTTQRTAALQVVAKASKAGEVMTRLDLDVTAAAVQITLRSTEKSPYQAALDMCLGQFSAAATRVNSAKVDLALSVESLEIATAVVKVFGPAGVRAQILDTVTPFLNKTTGTYLGALSDGEITATWTTLTRTGSGDLKEKFSIDVNHAKGGDSFSALSGGEKRKVRLATALALQDLMASRAVQPIDLLLLDEIDDALDPAGLERLMTMLEFKARERGTVIVISHSDLKDWVTEVTTVTKTGLWNSTVSGALCS